MIGRNYIKGQLSFPSNIKNKELSTRQVCNYYEKYNIHLPINNSINNNLNGVLIRQQMDNFHSMPNNPDSHEFLSIVSAVHHE